MQPASINRALINRANPNHAIEQLNNRIDGASSLGGGIDIVFKPSDIKGSDLNSILAKLIAGTTSAYADMSNATIYEAQVPSSRISNLHPVGMLKGRVVNNSSAFIGDVYQPLESFTRRADGSVLFNPIQSTNELDKKNYGGNIQYAIMPFVAISSTVNEEDVRSKFISIITSSDALNINNLYYIQFADYMSPAVGKAGLHVESLTLHFE